MNRREFLAGVLATAAVNLPSALAEEATPASELDRIKALPGKPEPITWLITGDSITHGALHTHGWRSYPEHFAERVRWELKRTRDVVINTGISGDRVPGLMKDLDHRVLRFNPTVVSIMMGMNDATAGPGGREGFRTAYNELIDRIRAGSKALILLQTPNPITDVNVGRQDLPAYAEIIREVARDKKTALVDQDKMWRERKTPLNYLLNDGTIHPNSYGHILFTHNMCIVLGIHDPNSNTGRLYIP